MKQLGRHRTIYLFLGAAITILLMANLWLFSELRALQTSDGLPPTNDSEKVQLADTPYRLLLVFSPTDCSVYYSAELATWQRLASELPPDRVSLEVVACYTNEEEFESWKRHAGVVLPRVRVDPYCRLFKDSKGQLPQISTPMKLLVDSNGDILYQEGPTTNPELNLALRDKVWDFIRR